MSAMASKITGVSIACSPCVQEQIKENTKFHLLAFVMGIQRGPMDSLHKRPVEQKMFPFDDVVM